MGALSLQQSDFFTKLNRSSTKFPFGERIVSPLEIKSTGSRSRGECAKFQTKSAPQLVKSNVPRNRTVRCEAFKDRQTAVATYDYNLYELLGIEKDARAQEIKRAYRWLQKRCHPDVAGAMGHDMAILLNDAYSVLSDPDKRATYDATCEENKDFEGFTGLPIYSTWYGGKEEDRAVFVEETRCIGCLKCALIAPDTFGIESKFGRARCQNQWLDDEPTIQDAVRACPVDCIWVVKKDMLPALEFIMSKQPRLLASLRNRSYVGVRQENVFAGAKRLLKKYADREKKRSSFQESSSQKAARMAAANSIHIKAGQWWRNFVGYSSVAAKDLHNNANFTRVSQGALIHIRSIGSTENLKSVNNKSSAQSLSGNKTDLKPLIEAVRRRRGASKSSRNSGVNQEDEYWTPLQPMSYGITSEEVQKLEPTSDELSINAMRHPPAQKSAREKVEEDIHSGLFGLSSAVPIAVAVAAAVLVGMNFGSDVARSEADFISSPLPPSITSGLAMQMFLAAVVWYAIGAALCTGAVLMTNTILAWRRYRRNR